MRVQQSLQKKNAKRRNGLANWLRLMMAEIKKVKLRRLSEWIVQLMMLALSLSINVIDTSTSFKMPSQLKFTSREFPFWGREKFFTFREHISSASINFHNLREQSAPSHIWIGNFGHRTHSFGLKFSWRANDSPMNLSEGICVIYWPPFQWGKSGLTDENLMLRLTVAKSMSPSVIKAAPSEPLCTYPLESRKRIPEEAVKGD